MVSASLLGLFVLSASVLVVTPVPSVLYIMARSMDQGRAAGLESTLGMAVGASIHVLAAAVGISALLMASALAFNVVKYLGAAYLFYLGVKTLFFSREGGESQKEERRPRRLRTIFTQSIVIEVLNPKTALFFLAFLPQFISPDAGAVTMQFLLLGVIFVTIGLLSDSMYVLLASSIRQWFDKNSRAGARIQRWFAGGTYIAMGLYAALVHPARK
ncbi:LysE family translocator [Paenibacillus roseipurpureus]|uniref:LysE family translocator n=1 Tax=Paenibacillus roseopurpureus TaxID=2918901 RepID=A0AA96RKJ5_9BACL|nr:LysE family translocator [Paenibacillus sp. MBLB1832]WNR44419.1 LysE family translocator [Paenibacillus sp. MBLB1832]